MHIGVIPDGNRRFMRRNNIVSLVESYCMGIDKFHQFLEWCIDLGVGEVTLYALSLENIQNRSYEEVSTLLNLFSEHALNVLNDEKIHKNRVKINLCGDKDHLLSVGNPVGKRVVESMERLEKNTQDHGDLRLNIALAYGGRQEIMHAFSELIKSGSELTEENLRKHLWISSYPDIILRTAESRLSNFLLWQSAYSEIYFIDKLWQEMEKEDLADILEDFSWKERRFGR
ncbi:MAG: di-trans,poly-cis-decaprenylcistransferase [Candidatus Altiarchaeota archaeon]|nr:di-trans,poly-cis-decaprenylcistransferase [Candidatus Altiarchaeota archaeon]